MNATVLSSSATSSLQSSELEPKVEQVDDMDEVQQVDEVEKMGQIDEMEEVEQVDNEEEVERAEEVEEEDQLDQVEQEALSSFSVAGGISDEVPLGVLLHVFVWTTNLAKPWISTLVLRFILQKASYYFFNCITISVILDFPILLRIQ